MRCIIPYHFEFRIREIQKRHQLHEKIKSNIIKKHENIIGYFKENEECELKLREKSKKELFSEMSVHHFNSVKADLLKSFIRLRMTENLLILNEKDIPKLKGNVSNFNPANEKKEKVQNLFFWSSDVLSYLDN